MRPYAISFAAVVAAAAVSACSSSSTPAAPVHPATATPVASATPTPVAGATATPTASPTPVATATSTASTAQVISLAIPTSSIGTTTDAAGDEIGGYTQQEYSQTLGFAPGSQVMLRNAQTNGTPHTLGDTGGNSATGFPASPALSTTANTSAGGTLGAGFQSGTIPAGTEAGPFTLAAGTYYIGCAYHYPDSVHMRDILVVAAGATPGPQATPGSGSPTPAPTGSGYGY